MKLSYTWAPTDFSIFSWWVKRKAVPPLSVLVNVLFIFYLLIKTLPLEKMSKDDWLSINYLIQKPTLTRTMVHKTCNPGDYCITWRKFNICIFSLWSWVGQSIYLWKFFTYSGEVNFRIFKVLLYTCFLFASCNPIQKQYINSEETDMQNSCLIDQEYTHSIKKCMICFIDCSDFCFNF